MNVGITALLHQEGRRVVLVFTDGVDGRWEHNISYSEVMKNAEEQDVMVFAIGLASRVVAPATARHRAAVGGFGRRRDRAPPESESGPWLPRIAL